MTSETPRSTRAKRLAFTPVEAGSLLLSAVVALADAERRHIGLLPTAAWADYARRGHVLAAVEVEQPERPLGYVAYRLPRSEVAIAQLVVTPEARGQQVARQLVEHLSATHADRRGLLALVRRDLPSYGMWRALDFVPIGDRPGRSAAGHRLTRFWRDHAHPDLLTWGGSDPEVMPVVMDANVFFDLHANPSTAHAEEVRSLLNVTLSGRIDLLVTPELDAEIDRNPDPDKRRAMHEAAASYLQARVPLSEVRAAEALLLKHGETAERKGLNDRSDLRHAAYAMAAGASALVTRDVTAIKRLADPASQQGVALVTPGDLVTLVDMAEDDFPYRPAAVHGTGYVARQARPQERDLLRVFLSTGTGEKASAYDAILGRLAATRPSANRLLIEDPSGQPVALAGTRPTANFLLVELLRVRHPSLAATLATHLVAALRAQASSAQVSLILINDEHLTPEIRDAAAQDGYRRTTRGLLGLTLKGGRTHSELVAELEALTDEHPDLCSATKPLLTALDSLSRNPHQHMIAAALEHQLRPVRMRDSALPCLLVPIKPQWSSDLFGVPAHMYLRPDGLGLGIEHVYYRSPSFACERAPARILWYVSQSGSEGGFVAACSQLVEASTMPYRQAWRRFRRLGIYSWSDVIKAADSEGRVRALRVIDSQVLPAPVPLSQLRVLARHHGQTLVLRSPQQISSELYESIMTESQRAGQA